MTKEKNYLKEDGHLDFKKLEKDIAWIVRLTSITIWFWKAKNTIEFISVGIVATLWMSLLLVFIWTGNLLLLKIWATPFALAAILACLFTGIEALRKNKEIDLKEKYKFYLSKEDLKKIYNSLNQFNDYERNIEPNEFITPPSYDEYKEFVLSIKPQLKNNEDLIKLWYMMFNSSRWTNSGFLIKDWKELVTKVMLNIDDQLEKYLNFYSIKQAKQHVENESGTTKV